MVSVVRDQVLALASTRHGRSAIEGRGIDQLPDDVKAMAEGALVRSPDDAEIRRAMRSACACRAQPANSTLVSAPRVETAQPSISLRLWT
jgi:hypothetical protein